MFVALSMFLLGTGIWVFLICSMRERLWARIGPILLGVVVLMNLWMLHKINTVMNQPTEVSMQEQLATTLGLALINHVNVTTERVETLRQDWQAYLKIHDPTGWSLLELQDTVKRLKTLEAASRAPAPKAVTAAESLTAPTLTDP